MATSPRSSTISTGMPPRNAEEARTLVGFFLDIIENNDAGDNIHLIERVRAIIDDCPGPGRPSMEIAHGAGI